MAKLRPFNLGPHILYKGELEISPETYRSKSRTKKDSQLALELTYGLTGDWAAGVNIPYVDKSNSNVSARRDQDDLELFTKYRFWRKDGRGLQQSMSLAFKLKNNTAENNLGTDTTGGTVGLSCGYEGRKWYHWAALRYRINDQNSADLQQGNKILLDLVGGIRPQQTGSGMAFITINNIWS